VADVVGAPWIITPRADGTVWMEDEVPVLSSFSVPSGTIGQTGATASVVTSVPTGVLYLVVTNSAVVPAPAQIIAGTDHNGNAPLFETALTVTVAGTNQIPLVGLSGTAVKYVYVIHVAHGFNSAPLSTSFLLSVVSAYPSYSGASVGAETNGFFNLHDTEVSVALAGIPLETGLTFGQNTALVPADVASIQFRDGWGCRVDFVEFPNDAPVQPTLVGTLRSLANAASLSVPVNTVPGIAADQELTMIILSRGPLTATGRPSTQGWTVRGTPSEPSGGQMNMYVYSKTSIENEPAVNLVHTGGRILVITSNWINVDLTTPFHVLPSFLVGSDVSWVPVSPSITPSISNTTIVSAFGHAHNPVFESQPPNYTVIDRFYGASNNFWLGAAYRKLPVAAATGALPWTFTADPGGDFCGVTFALKSSATGILKYGFDFQLQVTSPTTGQSLHNLRINP